MSLINKMLQDLDARGGASAGADSAQNVRAVSDRERPMAPLVAGGVAVVVLLAAGGWYGWRNMQQHAVDARMAVTPAIQVIQPVSAPAPVPTTAPTTTPSPSPSSAAPSASAAMSAPVVATQTVAAPNAQAAEARPQVQASADAAPPADKLSAPPAERKAHHGHRMPRPESSSDMVLAHELLAKPTKKAHADSVRMVAAPAPATVSSQGRELSLAQQSENAYRRALASLQEGRVNEAISGLDNALDLNPRNDGARQTLIGLLLENKRNEEAIHSLRLALAIDARQPPMAMLLARLQMEQGTPASATLLRSLPYAKDNAEYRAFLGTALQREQRNAEAAEQYQAALRLVPQNGVWWMGLGISLQADKRLLEAKDAYAHAKSSGSLNPELTAFVDRKLAQLPH